MMAGPTSPYIKSEPNEFFDPTQFMQYNQHQVNQMNNHNIPGNVNPANLTNGMAQGYMSSNYGMGNSGIADDELQDLELIQPGHQGTAFDFNQGMQNFLHNQQQQQLATSNNVYSHTPDGVPTQSPFVNDASYGQFRPMPAQQQQQFNGSLSMPQQGGFRPHMQQHMERKISDSRSPATPNTPAFNTLQMNDDFAHPGMQPIHHRHQSSGGNWGSTPSGHSWDHGSPFPSPANGQMMHPQISEVLKNTAHQHKVASSLPTKMEPGQAPYSTQEAKRRRRRESHNMVERRRRDNINERIHDLGNLVPQHRLEDDKVRKHLQTNAPLSPSIANGGASTSPPSSARRPTTAGAGNITQGLPLEDKDKGPNKGDILNGSVAWSRDIMWFLHLKLRQEQELQEYVGSLGGVWPFTASDDENRMRSEICEILNKHARHDGFLDYSRASGSGLRVPGYTNIAGDTINGEGQNGHSIPPMSPGFLPGGSGVNSGNFWAQGDELKEEEEFGMELQ